MSVIVILQSCQFVFGLISGGLLWAINQFIELIPMAETAALPDAEFLCQLRSALEHFSDKKNITEDQVRRYVEGFYNDRACVICYNAYIREWLSKPCDLKNFLVAIGIRDCKCYELIRAREKSQQYSSSSD